MSAPRSNLKSTFKVAYQSLLRAATKDDLSFQVASQSPLDRHLKSTLVASKVCSNGTTTSQALGLNAKLLLGNSPSRGSTQITTGA
jgi:hypothetical protein